MKLALENFEALVHTLPACRTLYMSMCVFVCRALDSAHAPTVSLARVMFQAFEEGGGGARAVAHRILAEAKAVASKNPKTEGPDPRQELHNHVHVCFVSSIIT